MKNFLTILMIPSLGFAAPVTTTEELVKAVSKASGETTIELSAGTFDVPSQLLIKTGTTLTGAGPGKTIITSAPSFKGNPATKTKAGLEAPLKFQCGMNGELTVDGWNTKLAP